MFENLYWVVGLVEDGDKFVKQMRDDELSHRQSMGQTIFSGEYQLGESVEERLRAVMRDLNRNGPITKMLSPKAVAGIRDDFKRSYIFYAQLSSDSAHPSVTALNRYVVADPQGPGFDTNPVIRPSEVAETLKYLSMSALGVCVAVNQILGGTTGGEQLQARAMRHDELSNRTRAESKRDGTIAGRGRCGRRRVRA
ncbi:hypothetical protein FDV58_17695 [Bradyrhizobium elkanii]|uniref:Uncharacterized protein n=1 Tax=Bradyrhizobium elkanii TaxID=29448 RepID=A0A4V6CXJ4_BRAEL|nr:hypothetical protein FDV58_17695 [Bradyrhizobium elkanii]